MMLAAEYASDMMSEVQLEALGRMLVAFDWSRGGIVVEIGTYHGLTAAYMAHVLRASGHPEVPVVSVDPFERSGPRDAYNAQGDYTAYCATIATQGVGEQCFVVAAPSQQAASIIPATIGVLVIDGNHTYDDCKAELDLYVPKVMHGGFVFIDDDLEEYYPGTVDAISDYFAVLPEMDLLRHGTFATVRVP